MNLKFENSSDGYAQDLACGILLSLSMLSDAARHMEHSSGCMRHVYENELKHHYDSIALDALRLLATYTTDYYIETIVSDTNAADIRQGGRKAFLNLLDQYKDCFNTESK